VDYSKTPNPKFESYYKRQGIVTDEEWPEFDLAARKELPVVFRINGRGPYALGLRKKLQSNFFVTLANSKNQASPHPGDLFRKGRLNHRAVCPLQYL